MAHLFKQLNYEIDCSIEGLESLVTNIVADYADIIPFFDSI
jgi:hypothetical protein